MQNVTYHVLAIHIILIRTAHYRREMYTGTLHDNQSDLCIVTTKMAVLYFKMNGYSLQKHLMFSLSNFHNILAQMI